MKHTARIITMGLVAALGLAVLTPVPADTYTVTNLNVSGAGSLLQAVTNANTAGGMHSIVFQDGLSGAISFTSASDSYKYGPAAMVVTCNLTITGPTNTSITIQRSSGTFRLFNVRSGASLHLEKPDPL